MTVTHDQGLFGPDSVAWRLHADPVMLIGGIYLLNQSDQLAKKKSTKKRRRKRQDNDD